MNAAPTILRRRYPCCGGSLKLDGVGPDEPAERRCPSCRRQWLVRIVPALVTERHPDLNVARLEWTPVDGGHRQWPGGDVCVQCRSPWPCPFNSEEANDD